MDDYRCIAGIRPRNSNNREATGAVSWKPLSDRKRFYLLVTFQLA